MSAHPIQHVLPHVGSRRLDPNWRARRDELLELERLLMLERQENARLRALLKTKSRNSQCSSSRANPRAVVLAESKAVRQKAFHR